jgi:hypothetical protein
MKTQKQITEAVIDRLKAKRSNYMVTLSKIRPFTVDEYADAYEKTIKSLKKEIASQLKLGSA